MSRCFSSIGCVLLFIAAAGTWVLADPTAAVGENEAAFTPLFDGQTLAGWVGATNQYEAVDGMLVCRAGGHGNLYTEREYADFVFRFEFRLTPGSNNGVALRAPGKGDPAYVGMEIQVLDNTTEKYGDLKPYQYHGSIYGVEPAKLGHLRPVGQWNEEEIRCVGRSVRVTLNGQVIVDTDLDKAAPGGRTIDGRDHPGLRRRQGHIGFLGHGDRVEFRKIRILDLGKAPTGTGDGT